MKSLLFVPAKEKMLKKVGALGADAYILDLEDSIPKAEKDLALKLLKEFLSEGVFSSSTIIVRLNKERYKQEIVALKHFDIAFMLPKFEDLDEYKELPPDKAYYALIETPKGLVNLSKIASCNYITALAFGAEDYTASIGMDNEIEVLQYPKSKIVTYGKAFGKKVYDTPCFKLNDMDAFEREVENARALGFDGKMAINPKQIEFINQKFSIADPDHMLHIIERYEECGDSVQTIDGKVYEKMHIEHMRKILKERACGAETCTTGLMMQ